MSYILEALKKADRERAAGHVPDLETVHRHESGPQRKPYRWVWLLGALFVFNGALVAVLATRHEAGHGRDIVAAHSTSGEHIASPPESARPHVPVESPPPARLPSANVASLPPRTPARPPHTAAPQPVSAVRPATSQGTTAVASPVAERHLPAAKPPATQAPAVAHGSSTIPDWNDLSLDFRSGFSMPHMDVHVYDSDPRRRFVLIDLQKFREGDRLSNGAVLEEILPDGIVLSYQGKRFHYGK
jgi:general secretion pathway protein B